MDDESMSTTEPAPGRVFRLGELTVDPLTGEMRGPAGCTQLDPKVMEVLLLLVQRAGDVVLRDELLERVWPGMVVTDDALSRCVYQLRRHLVHAGGNERYKSLLETLPKRGYRLNLPTPSAAAAIPRRRRAARFAAIAAAALAGAGTTLVVLDRQDYFWRNPLASARFLRLTDFDGAEQDAAISRDGKFVAFLADRDGIIDAWIKEIDGGELRNLTGGRGGELRNRNVRTVGFSPDGSDVTLWTRAAESPAGLAPIGLSAAPLGGGSLQPYLEDVAEVAWSRDGTRMVYHPAADGDPLFVTEPNEKVGRQIFVAPPGLHSHFPLWSPDDAFIYFVHGAVPDDMDIWRIPPTGGEPERITFHSSHVSYPVFLDARTLLYLATAEDGSGPWLYTISVERRVAHRIGFGLERYTSLSASGDGRRLVATVTTPRTGLWRVPVLDRVAQAADARPIELSTLGGVAPRFGPDYLLYLSPNDGTGLWKLADGGAIELWNGREERVVAGPAVEPDGNRIAFTVSVRERTQLYIMNADGTDVRPLAEELDVRGNPAWSPDGRWIAVAADRGGGAQLFRIPLNGERPVAIVDRYSIDPVWSPDGSFLVYRGPESGPSFPVLAVTAEGEPRAMPSLVLPRGSRSLRFLPDGNSLLVLTGELERKHFRLIDLETGASRQLSDFGPEFVIGDFDLSADGREIVFDRMREESDVFMIDLAGR